ncbi:MAG: HlyC/CorC family transporter [Bacteroidales bacterium]|nr:HlyC/CorC family transporter [Bacteroidales bacterium]
MDDWLIVIITLILSAFFSGFEIAFISSNKLKIEVDRTKGLFSARILSDFLNAPSKFIGALLLGNNIALVIYGIAMANILEPLFISSLPQGFSSEFIILLFQTITATLIILFFAEFIPKVFFRIYANGILNFFSVPIKIIYTLLYPIVYVFTGLSEFLLKNILKAKFTSEKPVFSPIDLDHFVKEFSPDVEDENNVQTEIQMFQNVIDFRDVKLRECLIPRTEIIAVEENDDILKLQDKFTKSGHSKILVYRESIDNIIGYAHVHDMFKKPPQIKSIIRPIIIVPETMLANNILSMFIQQQKNIAIVVDEFGGTSGMVSIEDLIEEIFGEIEDEYDEDDLIEKKVSDTEFIFDGRLKIDDLNEKYRFNLPETDDYETLAGLIIHFYKSIPRKNEVIFFDHFVFSILQASETRIEQVRLKIE